MSVQGKTEPRLFTPPLRELTPETSLGFACCEYAKTVLGETLYPWQEWALQRMLEITGSLGGEWHFRFRTIVIMVARQNGKTKLSAVLASFFLNILGAESIFGTSLDLAKAEEVWELVVAYQESVPALARLIGQISRTNGRKFLKIDGGCVYKTGAPSRHGGRGDSNDLVLIDELREQRNWELWSAAAPSINAKPKGLIVCFTNAGDPESVVLRTLRSRAMAAMGAGEALDLGGEDVDAEDLALFEWSAPEGAAMDDEAALAQANAITVGWRIGAGELDRCDRDTRRVALIGIALGVATAGIFALFARPILGLFTDDPQMVRLVSMLLVVDIVLEIGRMSNLVFGFALKTSGDAVYPMLVAVIIGVTNVIPFFGPFIGGIPATLLIMIEDPIKGLWFALFVLALQQLDGNVIGPAILGDRTGLSSFWVLFAIILCGGLWGIAGMIICVPMFAVIYDTVKKLVRRGLHKKGQIEIWEHYKADYPDEVSPKS